MEIFNTYTGLPDSAQNAVIAIGNFDGVHKGHGALFAKAKDIAREKSIKVVVLTFEPHPRVLFRPDDPPFRLTPPSIKRRRLAQEGIDILYEIPFDWDFASQPPEIFIENVLTNGIKPAHIVIGDDFRFGQLRKGTPDTLKSAGFDVTVLDKINDDTGADYSSSRIRQALRHGKIDEANNLLGWDWEIEGTIVRGDQRGRELGYPTANVKLHDTIHPAYGVYASWAKIEDDGPDSPWLPSVTNIGIRPMFEIPVGQVETYIFDFDRDIYDKTLRVRPVQKLRGEAKFESIEKLVEQIAADCGQAKQVLNDHA